METQLGRRPRVAGPGATPEQVHVTRRLGRVLEKAFEEAKRLNDDYVSVEHLLMALIDEGVITGVPREKFAEALNAVRGNQRVTSSNPEAAYEALETNGDRPGRGDPPGDPDPVA
jgi:ATP-dependent Clp protease ATP-binding subunit ClpB